MERDEGKIVIIPEYIVQALATGEDVSMTIDNNDENYKTGETFYVQAFESGLRCEVEALRALSGPAIDVFAMVKDEPTQSGASVLDCISGLAASGRPPTTTVTFLRIRRVMLLA